MKGVRFLKGTPIQPVVPEIPNPVAPVSVPGQGSTTAALAAQSAQVAGQSLARNNQVAAQSALSLASSATQVGVQQKGPGVVSDLAGLGDTIIKTFQAIQEGKQKQAQEEALFDLTRDAEELRRNALDIISSDGGMASYDTAASNLLQRYRGRVPYEQFEEIFGSVTNAGKEAYSTVNGRLYQESVQLQDATVAMKEREALLSNRALIASLSSVDPNRRQEGWDGIRAYLDSLATSGEFDTASYMRIATAMLDAANEADIQPGLIEEEFNRVSRNTDAIIAQQEAYQKWLNNQTPQGYNQYDLDIAAIRAKYPDAPVLADDPNVFFQRYEAMQELVRRRQVLVMESPQARSALESVQDFDDQVVNQLALFLAHPSQGRMHMARIQQLEQRAKDAGLVTDWPSVLAQAESYTAAMGQLPTLNKQVADAEAALTQSRLNMQVDAVNRLARWRGYTQTGQVDNLGMMMVLQDPTRFGIDPAQLSNLGGLLEKATLTQEEMVAAQAVTEQLDQLAYEAVQRQYTTALQQREQVLIPLRGVGVGDQMLVVEQNGVPTINNAFFNSLVPAASRSLEAIQQNISQVNEQIRMMQQGPPLGMQGPPGGQPSPFSNPPLHRQTIGGVEAVLPFSPTTNAIPMTGQFGEDRSTHNHAGVDFAVPIGTPILNYVGGTVEAAGMYGNYGFLVDVRASDGTLHRFAHLDKIKVAVGDQVLPGDVLGLSGNTGYSTGPHLHWEVILNADEGGDGTPVDPIQWSARNIAAKPPAVRGGSNPSSAQLTGVPLDNGGWYSNGMVYNAQGRAVPAAYTASTPMYQAYAPSTKQETASGADKNYGYSVVASDTQFRIALHQMASRLDIPAQWILDVMAKEVGPGLDPTSRNPRSDAYGLIQFLPRTVSGLKRNYPHLQEADLYSGDRVRQLRWVEAYLGEMRENIDTIHDLAIGVFLGEPRLIQFKANPTSIRGQGDDAIPIEEYVRRLGRDVGRQYRPLFQTASEIHDRPVHNCVICQRMGNSFQPHEYTR